MKGKMLALLLGCVVSASSSAWNELGTYYLGSGILVQLGDVCDSTRFPLTPGNCTGTAGNPDWRNEVVGAMDRWHATTSNFEFFTDPAVGATTPGTCEPFDPNSTFFLADICGFGAFGGSTLAVALTTFFFDGVSLHSDVIFNTAFSWDAYDDAVSGHGGVIDFRRVAVHEFGHVAGLAHPFHEHAIMSPFIQETINSPQPDDVAGLSAIYGVTKSFAIADQNGNSTDEIVHVRRASTGETLTTIRDSSTGVVIRSMTFFNSGFQTVDAVLLPDEDGDVLAAPELAVLAIRMSDLRAQVQIRNIAGAEAARTITFAEGFTPLKLVNIGDADGNGVAELAMLAVRESDLSPVVEIRNSFGDPLRRNVFFAMFHSPLDMDLIIDDVGTNPPRLALLMLRWSDGRGVVEMRNSIGNPGRTKINVRSGVRPIGLKVIDDGGTKIAVLASRDIDGRGLFEVKDAGGALGSTVLNLNPGNTPLAIDAIDDGDGDGNPDLLAVCRRESDGRVNVQMVNSDGTNLRLFNLNVSFDAAGSIFALDDTDGDTFPEVALQLSRRTDARVAVDWRNTAGPNTATINRVWMSP